MLKKILLIPFCLSLVCSSLAYSQQTTKQKILEELSQNDLNVIAQEVTQELKKLSSEEKIELKESLLETIDQLSDKKIQAKETQTALLISVSLFILFNCGLALLACYECHKTFRKKRT